MDKLLTIIIPSYNMEQYIENCCSSLLLSKSKMDLLEILIINDGSTDNTSEFGHRFQTKYPNVFRVVDKANGHYGSCINAGLKLATGKYVKILDADDTFDTEVFDAYIDILNTHDIDLLITDYKAVDQNGDTLWTAQYPLEPRKIQDISSLPDDIYKFFPMHVVTYKTQRLEEIGYVQSEGILYTDMEWVFLPMSNVNTFIYFDKSLYLHLIGRDGQSIDPIVFKKNMWMEINVTKKMIADYTGNINNPSFKNKHYIDNMLFDRCRVIYEMYLIKHRKNIDMTPLMRFDEFLKKELPIKYEELNSIELTGLKFKYIKNWRRSLSNAGFGFWIFYRVYDIQETALLHRMMQTLFIHPIKYILKKVGLFETVKRIVKGKNCDR